MIRPMSCRYLGGMSVSPLPSDSLAVADAAAWTALVLPTSCPLKGSTPAPGEALHTTARSEILQLAQSGYGMHKSITCWTGRYAVRGKWDRTCRHGDSLQVARAGARRAGGPVTHEAPQLLVSDRLRRAVADEVPPERGEDLRLVAPPVALQPRVREPHCMHRSSEHMRTTVCSAGS